MSNDVLSYNELNDDQKRGYDAIMSGENVYIDGKGGSGKSTLLDCVREVLGERALFLAPTGIAALNIKGSTIHRTFGFPLGVCNKRVRNHPSKKVEELFKDDLIKTILLDEISMVRADIFEAIDQNLRLVKRKNIPFGGVQVVCVGDFGQLSPVLKPYGYEKEVFSEDFDSVYSFTTNAWKSAGFTRIHLSKIVRQSDEELISHLSVIRSREENKLTGTLNYFNQHCNIKTKNEDDIDDDGTFLCTTNKKANAVNEQEYEGVDGEEKVYHGQVKGPFKERPAPEYLPLKVGTKVMITANDNTYINGMIGYVSYLGDETVEVMTDEHTTHIVEPFEWNEYEYTRDSKGGLNLVKRASYKQIPIKHGYAFTVHKIQGLTLDSAIIDCSSKFFAHGMLYVALSRVKTLEGITLIGEVKNRDVIFDQDVKDFYAGKHDTLLA